MVNDEVPARCLQRALVVVMLLIGAFGMYGDVSISINNVNGATVTVCEPQMSVTVWNFGSISGTYDYALTLFRDGVSLGTKNYTAECVPEQNRCDQARATWEFPTTAGSYEATVSVPTRLNQKTYSPVIVKASPPCKPTEKGHLLHLAAVTSDNRGWHSIRHALEYTWSPFFDFKAAATDQWGNPGKIVEIATAVVKGELHVAVLNEKGRIFHTIRWPKNWQGFRDIHALTGIPGTTPIRKIAASDVNGEFHLAALTEDGTLWHTIRHENSWDKFGNATSLVGRAVPAPGKLGKLVSLDAGTVNNELHVVVLDDGGRLWHTIRHYNSWDKLGDLQMLTGTPGAFTAVSVAGLNSTLHVAAITGGKVWHTIRYPTKWDRFNEATVLTGSPGAFKQIALSASQGEMHVVGVTEDGGLWHTIRHTAGWDKFGNVRRTNAGDRGQVMVVAIDGVAVP